MGTRFTTLNMPPMSFLGVVAKAGFMNKTATVAVSRWVVDAKTGKVRHDR
jgi:small subunit ribosomal protein S17